ncbi:MAG: L,D-transpeptidase [Anaerolineales bacterium]
MPLSRRDFIKLAGGAAAALAIAPYGSVLSLGDFPQAARLGRLTTTADLRSAPRIDFPSLGQLGEDTVVPVLREVIAGTTDFNYIDQRWVETPSGYLYSGFVQPVKNLPNEPLREMPAGKNGFWAEVTVPYVDFVLENLAPASPWLREAIQWGRPTRLYYSQVMWIDQISTSPTTGAILYRVTERYGSYGDIFWAEGAAFRPITEEEVAPIHPDVDPAQKKIYANLNYQTISCYEGEREVYFCRMSSGSKHDIYGNPTGTWSTPLGTHWTWRKSISMHMAGNTVGSGWDTPGVSWTTLFSGTGIAIHATFWHNLYGMPRSHGCLNVAPEDAKWIFRWTTPLVSLEPGDITIEGPSGTHVTVEETTY